MPHHLFLNSRKILPKLFVSLWFLIFFQAFREAKQFLKEIIAVFGIVRNLLFLAGMLFDLLEVVSFGSFPK